MSGQVDFYVLKTSDEQSRMRTVCRLAQKVHKLGHDMLVLTADSEQSKQLDELMWTFSQSSFLPHAVVGSRTELESKQCALSMPVLIHHLMPEKPPQVLINLKDDIPQCPDVKRIVEIVDQDEQVKHCGRHKFRTYKNKNFLINTHEI